ncbi:hypothetical protein IJG28_00610 [Candidatus Saccharibacteria bacterium]|nr:hypothetical protein [Candidatus Saccharibacteria bacterium]
MKKRSIRFIKQNRDCLVTLGYFLAGVIGVVGVAKVFDYAEMGTGFANSLLSVLLLVLQIFIYAKMFKIHKRNEMIFEVVFSIFLAGILVIGAQLDWCSEIMWGLGTVARIFCLAVFVFPIMNVLMTFLGEAKINNFEITKQKKFFWVTFMIIAFGGLIVWLATYPGIWGYDAATQFATITNVDEGYTQSVGAHYSLPLGWLMTSIMTLGKNMFGNYQAGMALCSLLQMLFLSYVATRILIYATEKVKNKYLYIIGLVFFVAFPLYTAMTVYMTQDAVFGALFALAFIHIYELSVNDCYWARRINYVLLSGLLLTLCLCRNNGFYCLVVAFIVAVVFMKGRRVRVALIFGIPMLLYQLYNGPFLSILNISTASSISEMLSVPSQQIARVYNYNNDLIGADEKEQLDAYYSGYKDFIEYRQYPAIADFTKRYIVRGRTSSDLTGYVKLWLKIGTKDPKNYIEAFLLNNLGFWYPNKKYPDTRMGIPYYEYEMTDRGDDRFLVIERTSQIPMLNAMLKSVLVDDAFVKVPILSTICSMGTYFVLFCFVLGYSIVRKNWKKIVPLGLMMGLYITLLLSPVAVFRYCFPIVILWPLLFAMLFEKNLASLPKKKRNVVK